MKLELVWALPDIFNAFMALPNLIGLLALSPVIVSETRKYFQHKATAFALKPVSETNKNTVSFFDEFISAALRRCRIQFRYKS
jgi:hypothetical protein